MAEAVEVHRAEAHAEQVLAFGGPRRPLVVHRRHEGEHLVHHGEAGFGLGDPRIAVLGGGLGGGQGLEDSHKRSERIWGSAATSWLSAVVPVRGRPMTNTGPSTCSSLISGCPR